MNITTMEKLLIKILPFFIILIIGSARGQSNIREAQYKYGDKALRNFLESKLDQARKRRDFQICLISVTFAKFTVDSTGNINNISISENGATPSVFREVL